MLRLARANGAIPATQAAISRAPAFAPGGPEHLYVQELEDGIARPRPQTPAYPAITAAFSAAFLNIAQGGDVRRALDTAARPDRPQPGRPSLLPAIGALSRMPPMPPTPPPASPRPPLLARLRVGTKLMLLALLPVGVLVGFMTITAVNDWDAARDLQTFQAATRQAFALGGVADQLARERTAAVLLRLQPSPAHQAGLAAAQRGVDQALRRAGRQAGPEHRGGERGRGSARQAGNSGRSGSRPRPDRSARPSSRRATT